MLDVDRSCPDRARSVPDEAGTYGHSRAVRGTPSKAQVQVRRDDLGRDHVPSSAYKAEVGRITSRELKLTSVATSTMRDTTTLEPLNLGMDIPC